MKLLDNIKKKGIKGMFLGIPTRRTPRQIEHNIKEEINRARVIRVLNRIQQFFDGLDIEGFDARSSEMGELSVEISALIRELESYK